MESNMKKIILWLCKVFKVNLVEPIKQETYVNYVHEKVPFTQIEITSNLNPLDFQTLNQPEYREYIILEHKKHMIQRISQKLVEEDILKWDEYEDIFTPTYKIRCSFYAAKKPEQYESIPPTRRKMAAL
jgi:hypothetical protein